MTVITPEEYLKERTRRRVQERVSLWANIREAQRILPALGHRRQPDWRVGAGDKRDALHRGPSDLRVRISEDHYVYPDTVVVCEGAKFADDQKDTLLNPRLIIEVLSQTTEAYDRGYKAIQYRKLESLKEYVFVSQTEPHVEIFRRDPEGWILTEREGLDGVCHLESVGCDLRLADIFEKVSFEVRP